MYNLKIKTKVDKQFSKLAKKNPKLLKIIAKKISEIRSRPLGYKNLRKPLQQFKRVHIDKHFVLIFRIDHNKEVIEIWHFDNHNKVYLWKP